jgi:peptidoglycan/LPS O-acetylase OafA/YrhL
MRASRANAFDLVRFMAPFAVLYSHSFPLTGRPDNGPGALAVYVFFIISGYLIAQSWEYDPHPLRFATKRVLRIIPALVVVIVVSTFAIGPVTTALGTLEYFRSPQTYAYLFGGALAPCGRLPGVFDHLPNPCMNGPLWTLPYEMVMYGVIALLGMLLPRRLFGFGLLLAFSLFFIAHALEWNRLPILWRLAGQFRQDAMLWCCFFILASLIWSYRIPLNRYVGVAAAIIAFSGIPYAMLFALPYAVLTFATQHRFFGFSRYGDFSYGVYIWAFPVQQLVVSAGITAWLPSFLLTAVLTLCLAALSWHFIEAPALRLKKRRRATASASAV